ncbi:MULTISPECIES: YraN family protein [Eggerthella]|uniref:YraN family protein n=1 Tax=Eggerthella TaxID=84111 RepID=UPI00189BC5C2|nr:MULTISPECIES: YraN family protein [Eggerthella]MCB5390657.1 YraN family protein [Eggerthella lenta]
METIDNKAMRGISSYLTRHGYDILEEGWTHGKDAIDFIARDERDELVFIATRATNGGNKLPAEKVSRRSLERIAAAYLSSNIELPEGAVRFDFISMLILGDSKALIRHHRNALGDDSITEV